MGDDAAKAYRQRLAFPLHAPWWTGVAAKFPKSIDGEEAWASASPDVDVDGAKVQAGRVDKAGPMFDRREVFVFPSGPVIGQLGY